MKNIKTDRAWCQDQVARLPEDWQRVLLKKWTEMSRPYIVRWWDRGKKFEQESAESPDGNIMLRDTLARIKCTRLPLWADDSSIRERAEKIATECRTAVIQFVNATLYAGSEPLSMQQVIERHGAEWARPIIVELRALAMFDGIETPWDRKRGGEFTWGGVARMMCAAWWRRQLRTQFAKAVEGAAISIGHVNRARQCYVSDQSIRRRIEQNKRNAQIMRRTILQNEEGQEFTLSELAARGMGNKALRRGELMTRISGFEEIARADGHDGLFLTLTCPSKMHKWVTVPGTAKVYENRKYDGTTPRAAQQYLVRVGARIRAALKRKGLGMYGFRIAEPNHDGTPHWHVLVFCGDVPGETKRRALPRIAAIFRRYALQDSPDEVGARNHRLKAVRIDWSKGTAAGYIAKYVAKNIDGMYIEKDLLGNDSVHVAARVEAWAATWGIRQFQQIGGAPVTVWRELRRIKELPEDAPEHLRAAWHAVNKWEVTEPANGWSDDWDEAGEQVGEQSAKAKGANFGDYVRAQGGAFVGRDYKVRMRTKERAGEGAYGDPFKPVLVGVQTVGRIMEPVGALGCVIERVGVFVAESVRHTWKVVRGSIARAAHAAGATWTRVNNCTPGNARFLHETDDCRNYKRFAFG